MRLFDIARVRAITATPATKGHVSRDGSQRRPPQKRRRASTPHDPARPISIAPRCSKYNAVNRAIFAPGVQIPLDRHLMRLSVNSAALSSPR